MSSVNSNHLAEISGEEVSELCVDKFKILPKTGKPNNNEWTVLAGVVMQNRQTGRKQVVSLGCGTKCIGKSKLCPQGLILNDSHAEVMARRGLIRYIYHQLNKSATKSQSIFEWIEEKRKFQLKVEISLHFFSSQTPCGDACIIDKNKCDECMEEPLVKKSKLEEVNKDDKNVGSCIDSMYTGAKLLGSYHIDAMEQVVAAVRTKPGRGERTSSMSCSDKLAKWQIMGIQGSLLDFMLTKPVYFETLNFLGDASAASLERAIWERFKNNKYENSKYNLHIPDIRVCKKPDFQYAQDNIKQPSPNGLVWCDMPSDMKPYEISVNGKRQGTTVKKQHTPHSALKICKFFLLKEFIHLIKLKPDLLIQEENLETKTYLECKFLAQDYQEAWSDLKLHYFKQWSQKPNILLKFTVEEVENKANRIS